MLRYLLVLLFCISALFGDSNKIEGVVPFGDNHLKLVFENNIDNLELKQSRFDSRHIIDFDGNLRHGKRSFEFKNKAKLDMAQNAPGTIRVVIRLQKDQKVDVYKDDKSLYIKTFDNDEPIAKKQEDKKATPKKSSPQKTTSTPKQAVKKVEPPKPKKIIVIDPGHGGHDCGAIGYYKVCEKVIVLNLSKLIVSELKKRGYETYITRNNDKFIDLIKRTEFANKKNADLFISIHANSIANGLKSPVGIETYFLSTARSERARKVAEIENQGDVETMNHFSKETFLDTINSHRLLASNKLAIDVQYNMLQRAKKMYTDAKDGGVREGPFWVLAGALMPSILIEIGYTSHKIEGKRIRNKNYQALLAKGIADGIDGYFDKND